MGDEVGVGGKTLEHEAGHLVDLAIGGGIAIYQRCIRTALQQVLKIITVYGHLIIYSSEPIAPADIIGYERGVADMGGHKALVA